MNNEKNYITILNLQQKVEQLIWLMSKYDDDYFKNLPELEKIHNNRINKLKQQIKEAKIAISKTEHSNSTV